MACLLDLLYVVIHITDKCQLMQPENEDANQGYNPPEKKAGQTHARLIAR
jgi:hypothetical protein